MKITVASLALLAASAVAAPAPAPDDAATDNWCERPGQSCWKEKRAAEAEAWCERPGQSCWKVKRAAEAFADSIASSGGLEARSPEAELSNLPGGAAFETKRTVDELAHLVSLSKKEPAEYYNNLDLEKHFEHDSDSKAKRDALPAPWCERPGQSCRKRDAGANDPVLEDKRWCERPGQSCWKAKRAAEAVLDVVGGHEARDLDNKSFDPEFAKRDAQPWCERPGQSCRKREADAEAEAWCERPGQSCWKAKRDLHSIRVAARGVLKTLQ